MTSAPPRATHKIRWIVAATATAAVALLASFISTRHAPGVSAPVLRPLTSHTGSELHPQVSPDGERVVYCWNGPGGNNFDVYVIPYRGGAPTRLTSGPSRDVYATWSPDGKTIAFSRNPGPRGAIYSIPADGGPERKLTDAEAFSFVFTRDGKSLIFADRSDQREAWYLTRLELATGAHTRLTDPPEDTLGDASPALSPDGKWLAFVRHGHGQEAEICVQPAAGGESVRLTSDHHSIFGISWMPNGREIVFSSDREDHRSLWRLPLRMPWLAGLPQAEREPERIAGAGENALHPFCARTRAGSSVIAYQRLSEDYNLWIEDLDSPAHPHSIATSARWEMTPSFSPDGAAVAFASERSGSMQIWTSDLTGANARQLTHDPDLYSSAPQWSPDGDWIVYESRAHGAASDLYVVRAQGGAPRRLTQEPFDDRRPVWSADGKWIYYRSDSGGSDQIWKIGSEGGEPVAVTLRGGRDAAESPDGRTLYICRSDGLYSRHAGQPDKRLVMFPCEGRWSVSSRGILYFDGAFHLQPFDGGPARDIDAPLKLDLSDTAPFAISRDGRRMVWSNQDARNSDALLLEAVR